MDVYAVAISAMRHYSDGTGATTVVAPGLLRVEVGSDPHEEALASAAREFPQTDGWHSHKVGTVRVPDDWLCQCRAAQ